MNKQLLLYAMSLSALAYAGEYTNRFSVFVDGLYWQAREGGLDYAIQNNSGLVRITNGTIARMEFDKKGGFRIGATYGTPCGDYLINVFWTRYHTTGNTCLKTAYPKTLFPVWSNPASAVTSEQNANSCSKLHLDMFDARIATLFDTHKRVDFFYYAGIVYARIDQAFTINMSGGQSNGPVATVLTDTVIMQNNFKGTGPKFGIQTIWDAAKGFALVAKADAALTYGKFDLHQNETTTFSNSPDQITFLNIPCNTFHTVRPIIDLMLGIRWDRELHSNNSYSEKRYNFYVEAGWELNYFFAQNMLMRFTDDIAPGANIEVKGDLATQGLTVRFNIGF